jgi:hypothetical protein
LQELESEFEHKYKNASEQIEYLMNDLSKLWAKIDIDQEIRDDFTKSHPGVGVSTTAAVS